MPNEGETSASYPGPRSDLESHGYAPDFVPTAAEQLLILFTHIVKSFGIIIAVVFNAIFFIPFLIFGIIPALLKKRFCSTPVYSPLPLTNFDGKTEHAQGVFHNHGHHRTQIRDGDVSPLLLAADVNSINLILFEQRAIHQNVQEDEFPVLLGPTVEFPSLIGGSVTKNGPVKDTQSPVQNTGSAPNGIPNGTNKSGNGNSDSSHDVGLITKNNQVVDLLNGNPNFGSGHSSALSIPGHGQGAGGNTVTKRETTWDVLQEVVYQTSKVL